MDIWKKISKKGTFFCLAPMIDVTDTAFRQVISKYSRHGKPNGGPDVFWTEFISADGLASKEGRKKLLPLLRFSKKEKPIIAQIFGSRPENVKVACELISKLGFDGVDINMGCPDRAVMRQNAGAALMKDPKLAREIIRAAKAGAPKLPISVKTRLGFNSLEYKTWLPELLKEDIQALTIHLRTKKEMSKVPAHWELAKDIAKVVRENDKDVVLIANGDIVSVEDGKRKAKGSGFDGVMIGRGVFGNPWLYDARRKTLPTPKERLKALREHVKLFDANMRGLRNFATMKKHFKAYVSGFEGAKELRMKLMSTNSSKEALDVIIDKKWN
ncbi:MAG: tRNA-dihydrouridine synthase [Candidatus Paceibacterota bacterium]